MHIILKRWHVQLNMFSTHHCDHYCYPIIDKEINCCIYLASSFRITLVTCCSFQKWSQSIHDEWFQHCSTSIHQHKTKLSCSLPSFPIIISFPFKQHCQRGNASLYSSMIKRTSTYALLCLCTLLPLLACWQHVNTKYLSNGVLSTLNYYLQFWRHFQSSHFFFIPISCILLSLC